MSEDDGDPDGIALRQRWEPTAEERELGLTVQHLSIQNMYLTKAAQEAQRNLHQEQKKVHALELKLHTLNQEGLPQQDRRSTTDVELKLLTSARAEDSLKITALESQLNMLRLVSHKDEACTQTEEAVEEEASRNRETNNTDIDHTTRNNMEMEKFKEEMNNRREARHRVIGALSAELERLRAELCSEKKARQVLEEQSGNRSCPSAESVVDQNTLQRELEEVKQQLANGNEKNQNISQQCKYLADANEDLTNRLKEETLKYEAKVEYSERRIGALKEVASLSKQMLSIRESQVSDLKFKVESLQKTSEGSGDGMGMGAELESQVQNVVELKTEYESHIKSLMAELEKLGKESEDKSTELEMSHKTCLDLRTQLEEMEVNYLGREEINKSLQAQLELSYEERKNLSNEIALINSIFTQMLVANSSTDMDLDKLAKMLQENHDLITEMTTKENGSNCAAGLPKLLLDLINQIDNEETPLQLTSEIPETGKDTLSEDELSQCSSTNKEESEDVKVEKDKLVDEECNMGLGVEEIASNLPKVWRILMELLSHHKVPAPAEECKPSCYKCIETPAGPRFVPSVSNTYIRLKDLILEKKYLQKDLGKLKQLNSHLESKLQEQEKRLTFVSAELKKTWGVVGKLRSQYRQLHTHEQILRYELQQKRHLLTELKTELEYCREKWERAREMNNKTEIEWKKLRKEFAERKKQDGCNSRESGYSDDRENESGDEEEKSRVLLGTSSSQQVAETVSNDRNSEVPPDPLSFQTDEPSLCHLPETLPSTLLNDLTWQLPTMPLHQMTSLKEQLHIFSQNLNSLVTTESEKFQERQALHSIFSLPPIQIPGSLTRKKLVPVSTVNLEQTEEPRVSHHDENIEKLASQSCVNDYKIDSKSSDKPKEVEAGSSSSDNVTRDALGRTPEEALAARAARLKRLEEQTQLLFNKVTRTTNLSNALNNRLEELHEQYGVPNPPPLPIMIPAIRIPVHLPSDVQPINERLVVTIPTDSPTLVDSASSTTNISTNLEEKLP